MGAMRRSALILVIALISPSAIASDKDTTESGSNAALSAQGKKIFVSRCAQCHDDDASKKLPDGTTLLQRLAKTKELEARLHTRLKNAEESHAVAIYIQELLSQPPGAGQRVLKKDSH